MNSNKTKAKEAHPLTNDVPLNIKIGQEQDLFFFSEHSPGSCFWLPNGTHIYNTLMDYMKLEYRKRGYQEVKTPIIGKKSLWSISGHWDQYKENMFCFDLDHNVDPNDEEVKMLEGNVENVEVKNVEEKE
jgi:threonyl-tRNA synthetase